MNDRDIFHAALEITDPAERTAYLERACAGDAALIERFEGLLGLQPQLGSFLEAPALGGMRASEPVLAADRVFAGRFTLRQRLGEGGMGEVWVADQLEPVRRRVALKVVRPGYDSARMLARFDQERQALALMDHPNIAKVLDAGALLVGGKQLLDALAQRGIVGTGLVQEGLPLSRIALRQGGRE